MRTKIYISHANPEDNIFARWLALKLMALGYEVWCDVIQMELGVDFWKTFEFEIRNNSKRFLFVATEAVKSKDNALRELAVAEATRRNMKDEDPDKAKFMIALRLDPNLRFDQIDPVLIRTNAAEFAQGWAEGLGQLVDQFDKDAIPRRSDPNHQEVKAWWDSVYATSKIVKEQPEIYRSNWFFVKEMPKHLSMYQFKGLPIKQADIEYIAPPARLFKNRILTFASRKEVNLWLQPFKNSVVGALGTLPIERIVKGSFESRFISNKEAKYILIELLNKSWNLFLGSRGLKKYEMANGRQSYWIHLSEKEPKYFGKGQLIGVQKKKHWHFAISGSTKLYPIPAFSVMSHIVFTFDGKNAINNSSIQHRARRKQGRNWWNAHWRDKLGSMMQILLNGEQSLVVPLSGNHSLKLEASGLAFNSPVTYYVPDELPAETEAESDWDDDDNETDEG